MTARRLHVDGFDGSEPLAIPGVAAPIRGAGRAYSLAQVLEIVLETAGLPLGYEAVMGLSGLAWRTPPWPSEGRISRREALDAVRRLGSALSAGLDVQREPVEQDALARVQESVDAGRPAAALGWGAEKDEWSVICGYDAAEERLLGHCLLDAPRDQYESWPAHLDILVTLPEAPEPAGRVAIERALRLARPELIETAPARYRAWARELREIDEPPSSAHERAVEMLADARSAAASFARSVAEHEREVAAAWLREAAAHWRELIQCIEARGAPHTPEAMAWLETPEGRDAWAATLERAGELDSRAATAIQRSSTADFLPDEVSYP